MSGRLGDVLLKRWGLLCCGGGGGGVGNVPRQNAI